MFNRLSKEESEYLSILLDYAEYAMNNSKMYTHDTYVKAVNEDKDKVMSGEVLDYENMFRLDSMARFIRAMMNESRLTDVDEIKKRLECVADILAENYVSIFGYTMDIKNEKIRKHVLFMFNCCAQSIYGRLYGNDFPITDDEHGTKMLALMYELLEKKIRDHRYN